MSVWKSQKRNDYEAGRDWEIEIIGDPSLNPATDQGIKASTVTAQKQNAVNCGKVSRAVTPDTIKTSVRIPSLAIF